MNATTERFKPSPRGGTLLAGVALLLLCLGTWSGGAAEEFSNSDCLDCHLDPTTTRKVDGKVESLVFPTKVVPRASLASPRAPKKRR